MRLLESFESTAYFLLRLVSGFMFAFHGVQKIFGVLSTFRPEVGTQMWFGGMIELLAGAAIMTGLATRWAALLASGTMAVAYFQFHWKLQMGAEFFPTINKGELAALYCFVFLYLACRGDGKWALKVKRG